MKTEMSSSSLRCPLDFDGSAYFPVTDTDGKTVVAEYKLSIARGEPLETAVRVLLSTHHLPHRTYFMPVLRCVEALVEDALDADISALLSHSTALPPSTESAIPVLYRPEDLEKVCDDL